MVSRFPGLHHSAAIILPISLRRAPMTKQRIFLSMVSDEFRSYCELLMKDMESGQADVSTEEKWGM